MKIIRLPYLDNLTTIFDSIASYPWSIWLDSGAAKEFGQRYDLITGFPYKTYVSDLDNTLVECLHYTIQDNDKISVNISKRVQINHIQAEITPLGLLNQELTKLADNKKNKNILCSDIPFWHGAMGYFGYDINQLIFDKLRKNEATTELPISAFGLYAWGLVYDHKLQQAMVVYDPKHITKKLINQIVMMLNQAHNQNALLPKPNTNEIINGFQDKKFKCLVEEQKYKANFEKIKNHIKNGDCYQINYALPFELNFAPNEISSIDSWSIYQYLKQRNKNPFGCYFKLNQNLSIMSFSPERFLQLKDDLVTAEPIKGTTARNADVVVNKYNKQALMNSEKDRAENIMIVDLMRNDLNKACVPGSVEVRQICGLHSFTTVHHLISTITGKLDTAKYNTVGFFQACFPGGSITGAPKLRSMQIIQELENTNNALSRYVYCGSIGYFNIDGTMDTNIAIRTVVAENNKLKYWAGSGIVADSKVESEYQEIQDKLIKLY